MDINNILSQLGVGSKETVYLSVTPNVGLELIQLDTAGKTVKNYAYRPLEYNESLRCINDMELFKNAVLELFDELKINIKCNIILNLPMVLFGIKELPILLGDEAITEALTSEVEQSYIFKRFEPIVRWVDSPTISSNDSRKLFYTALQKNTIDDIRLALTDLGANLYGIEMSLTSILKALDYSGLAANQMQENYSWNLLLIHQNGYSLCSMLGKNIVDYYEEPLALKSFEGDEIYNAINASAQITLMSYPANNLFIISQTNLVSAEILASRIQTEGSVNYLENNEFKKQDILPVSLEVLEDVANKVSLEAIGIAAPVNLPVKFNFIEQSNKLVEDPNEPVRINIGGTEFNVSPNAARNITFLISVILLLPVLAISLLLVPNVKKSKNAQLEEVKSNLQKVNDEIARINGMQNVSTFDVNNEIKNVLKNNRAKLMSYMALGDAIPRKVWLTYFVAKDDGKFDIKGDSANVEDIYTFYRNMKDSLINTQLRLHKLELKSNSEDDAVKINIDSDADYEFEITNMADGELNPKPPAHAVETPPAEQQPVANEENKSPNSFAPNKPLINLEKINRE